MPIENVCPYCGCKLNPNSTFCRNCCRKIHGGYNTLLPKNTQNEVNANDLPEPSPILIWGVVLVSLALFFVINFWGDFTNLKYTEEKLDKQIRQYDEIEARRRLQQKHYPDVRPTYSNKTEYSPYFNNPDYNSESEDENSTPKLAPVSPLISPKDLPVQEPVLPDIQSHMNNNSTEGIIPATPISAPVPQQNIDKNKVEEALFNGTEYTERLLRRKVAEDALF